MANEIPNAVALRKNVEWREWLSAASAYQARVVILEDEETPDHMIRLAMARVVAFKPEDVLEIMVTAVSTDPEVCSLGDTAGEIGQAIVLQKVAEVWTTIAKLVYQA